MQQPRPWLASGASVGTLGPSLNKIEINRIILSRAAADHSSPAQAESANGLNLLGTVHQLSYLIFIRPKTRQCHDASTMAAMWTIQLSNWFLTIRAVNGTEKAPTRAFSLLKAPYT